MTQCRVMNFPEMNSDLEKKVREAIADRGATPWTVVELEEVNLDAGE